MLGTALFLLTYGTLISVLETKAVEQQGGPSYNAELNSGRKQLMTKQKKVSIWLQSAKDQHQHAIEAIERYKLGAEVTTKLIPARNTLNKVDVRAVESQVCKRLRNALRQEADVLRYMWKEYERRAPNSNKNRLLVATFYVVGAVGDLVNALANTLSDLSQQREVSSAAKEFRNKLFSTEGGTDLPEVAIQIAEQVLNKTAVPNSINL